MWRATALTATIAGIPCFGTITRAAEVGDLPAPQIMLEGTIISGKSPPTRIVIGQVANYTATITGDSEKWTISPNAAVYGDFQVSKDCPIFPKTTGDCVDYGSVVFDQKSTEFYFTSPGRYNLVYKYTVGKKSASTYASLEVVGPEDVAISTPIIADVQLVPPGCTNHCGLSLGNGRNPRGILTTASGRSPKGFPGKFQWVQIIDAEISYEAGGTTYDCPYNGLDNEYPYSDIKEFRDSPFIELKPEYTSGSQNFSAATYLMWQPEISEDVQSSRPIVVGYFTWNWYGQAMLSQPGNQWMISYKGAQAGSFNPGYVALGWGSVVRDEMFPPCNPEMPKRRQP